MEEIREGWLLEGVPAYEGGRLSEVLYADGVGMARPEDGPENESQMICVRDTHPYQFVDYMDALEAAGWRKTYEVRKDSLIAGAFVRDGVRVYAYFTHAACEARIILDRSGSAELSDFELRLDKKPGDTTVIYQYGLSMAPDGSDIKINGKRVNCGQLYVIKLADNSLFLIDGAKKESFGDDTVEDFQRFLREITGTAEDEKIRIRCWFITHAHNDHIYGVLRWMKKYADTVTVERAMYNFTTLNGEAVLASARNERLRLSERLRTSWPDVLYHKPHTGERFALGDLDVEVLFTHEDNVDAKTCRCGYGDFNNTSTVLKIRMDEKTFLLLGDMPYTSAKHCMMMYRDDELRADAVQVAHHVWNDDSMLYLTIRAKLALFPQSSGGAVKNRMCREISASVMRYAEKAFYAGDETVGIAVRDGAFTDVCHRRLIGGDYTGWGE